VRNLVNDLKNGVRCGNDGVISYGVRRLRHEVTENLITTCTIDSQQVDFPLWIIKLDPKSPKLLLAEDQGSNCHALAPTHLGYPDLRCSYRVNMGEHPTSIYSFRDGSYQEKLSYTQMSTSGSRLIAVDLDR
jgi:hypothetical protein